MFLCIMQSLELDGYLYVGDTKKFACFFSGQGQHRDKSLKLSS